MPRKRINASGFSCTEDGCSFVNCSSFTSSGDNCKFVNCSGFTNAGDNCSFVNCNGVDLGDNSTSVNSHLTEASGGTKSARGPQKKKKTTTTGGAVCTIRTQGGQTFNIGGSGGTNPFSGIGIIQEGCEVNGIKIPRAASLIWGVPHFRGHPLTRENNARLFEERPDLVVFLDEVQQQQRHAAPVPAAASGSVTIGRVVLGRRRERDSDSGSSSSISSDEEEESPRRSRSRKSKRTEPAPKKIPFLTALTKDEEYILNNPDKDTDHPNVKEEDVCVVCSSRERNTVIMDCAHSCACLICMHKIQHAAVEKGEDGKCPMCNTKYTVVKRVFKS